MGKPLSPIISFEDDNLICIDENDQANRQASKPVCHDGMVILHWALSSFLFDMQGWVLLQQRSALKCLWPHWWANSCCSHPKNHELVAAVAQQHLFEELQLRCFLNWTHPFIYWAAFDQVGSGFELCHDFVGCIDSELQVNHNEIAATCRVQPAQLDKELLDPSARIMPWLHLECADLWRLHWSVIDSLVAEAQAQMAH